LTDDPGMMSDIGGRGDAIGERRKIRHTADHFEIAALSKAIRNSDDINRFVLFEERTLNLE
jgi:hypothetical protein